MRMKKLLVSSISLLLAIFFFINSPVIALQKDKSNYKSSTEKSYLSFEKLPGDTEIATINGIPLFKYDIEEDGITIKSSALERIYSAVENNLNYKNNVQRDSNYINSTSPMSKRKMQKITIPSGKNQATITVNEKSSRSSVDTEHVYLTPYSGKKFVKSLENSNISEILAMLAGFIPHIGPAISIYWTFGSLHRSNVKDQINKLTNQNKWVHITRVKSAYGEFFGANEWTEKGKSFTVIANQKLNLGAAGTVTYTQRNLGFKYARVK